MTKKEIIEILSKYDDNAEVLIPFIEDDGRMTHKGITNLLASDDGAILII